MKTRDEMIETLVTILKYLLGHYRRNVNYSSMMCYVFRIKSGTLVKYLAV